MGNKITFLIFLVSLIFNCAEIKAQLFSEKRFYPGVKTIISKQINSGLKWHWTKSYLDSKGRSVLNEKYWRNKLIGKEEITYNSQDDIVLIIKENYGRIDSFKFIYLYNDQDQITYQFYLGLLNDSVSYQLIRKKNDSLFVYKETLKNYRAGLSSNFELTYNSEGHVVEMIKEDKYDNNKSKIKYNTTIPKGIAKVITRFNYDDYGNRISSSLVRIPEYELKLYRLGDEVFYEYKYDKKSRVIKKFNIIGGKKYKIAKYRYKT